MRELLEESGKKQKELAREVGVAPQRISQYVNGIPMQTRDAYKIAYALGISMDELLCFDEYIIERENEEGVTGCGGEE